MYDGILQTHSHNLYTPVGQVTPIGCDREINSCQNGDSGNREVIEKAVEVQLKMQGNKWLKALRWDRKWIIENHLDWEPLWTEFQKWQEISKHEAMEVKGPFTGLLTEMITAILLKGAERWVSGRWVVS